MADVESTGFVGLGSLGGAIAGTLLRAGIPVTGYRRRPAEAFVALGGRLLDSPRSVFAECEIVCTCLSDDAALEEVIFGPDGFVASGAAGRLVVDFSTSSLEHRDSVHRRLADAGSAMLDCPVSGLAVTVEKRKALFLAAGELEDFQRVEPLLRLVSDEVHFVGVFGTGTVLKLLSNYLLVVHAAASAEAIAAAEFAGIDGARAADILARGAGGSFQLASRGPAMGRRDYRAPHATLDQLTKDLALIANYADGIGLHSSLLQAATEMVARTRQLGFGPMDPAAMIEAATAGLGTPLPCSADPTPAKDRE